MKICYDNLENIRLTKYGNFKDVKNQAYVYVEKCENCGEPFLIRYGCKGIYCSNKCSNDGKHHPNYGKHRSEETIEKIKQSNLGKKRSKETKKKLSKVANERKFSEETRKKMSKSKKGENHPSWKGGIVSKNLPDYDTYAHQIDWCEEVRRNKVDKNILEVKCAYCGKWYIPTMLNVNARSQHLKNNYVGERRFYCSKECKKECPIFWQQLYPKDFKIATSREVQPELRQMVLARDNYECQKCGSTKSLHCHHLEGIRWEPLESADIDKCITYCKNCHKEVHNQPDCGYNDMKCAA